MSPVPAATVAAEVQSIAFGDWRDYVLFTVLILILPGFYALAFWLSAPDAKHSRAGLRYRSAVSPAGSVYGIERR